MKGESPRHKVQLLFGKYFFLVKRGLVTIDNQIADILPKPSTNKRPRITTKVSKGQPVPDCKELTGSYLAEFQATVNAGKARKEQIAREKAERKEAKLKEREAIEERKRKRLEAKAEKERQKAEKQKIQNEKKEKNKMKLSVKNTMLVKPQKKSRNQVLKEAAVASSSDEENQSEIDSNICNKCGGKWLKSSNHPWIECDWCKAWFHCICTDISLREVKKNEGTELPYTCDRCLKIGKPTHKYFYSSSESSASESDDTEEDS